VFSNLSAAIGKLRPQADNGALRERSFDACLVSTSVQANPEGNADQINFDHPSGAARILCSRYVRFFGLIC
jgi:hypothetical protein